MGFHLISKQWQPPARWHDLEQMCELLYKAEFKPGTRHYDPARQSRDVVDDD
jgi:hypothetical protein